MKAVAYSVPYDKFHDINMIQTHVIITVKYDGDCLMNVSVPRATIAFDSVITGIVPVSAPNQFDEARSETPSLSPRHKTYKNCTVMH